MHWGKNNHFSQDTWRLLSGHFGPVTPGQLGDFGHEFICISPILPPFPPKESSQEYYYSHSRWGEMKALWRFQCKTVNYLMFLPWRWKIYIPSPRTKAWLSTPPWKQWTVTCEAGSQKALDFCLPLSWDKSPWSLGLGNIRSIAALKPLCWRVHMERSYC